eukprot:TRINITY_DN6654_c0_g1_i1.p2 TRINITY_DN6654_c0_g1~~TRINITY_DN6654_c0_g1_i1.p2  ORF type:complete len:203 (-),score=77.79 TRINITY_DN6654_c0_g1_i1:628-1236(-)
MELSRTNRLWLMLSLSTTYFLTELVVGILSNSMALAADAFHMLSDVLAMGVGIIAIRAAASSAPTRDNTYGYQRAELLGALANSVFLLALCFTIVIDAIKRLVEPAPLKHPGVVLVVGLVGLALNGGGLLIFMDFSSSGGGAATATFTGGTCTATGTRTRMRPGTAMAMAGTGRLATWRLPMAVRPPPPLPPTRPTTSAPST